MIKCEVVNLTPSDSSGSDSNFIQVTCHFCTYYFCVCMKFLYIKFLLHQVPATTEIILQDSCV